MSNEVSIRWTVKARDDLLELVDRIVSDNPRAAENFLNQLEKMTDHLRDFPELGHELDTVLPVRQILVYPARLLYLPDEKTITILACVQQNRDWQALLEDRMRRRE